MFTRIKQTIDQKATPRNTLLVFLCLLPFALVFFPWRTKHLSTILGRPAQVFDTRLPYTPQEVHQLAGDLGEPGRRLYALSEVTLDLAFPLLYASFLSFSLALVWRKAGSSWAWTGWLPLLPYLGMLGDYTENASLASLMMLFPGEPAWLVWFSNLGSLVKWLAGAASLVMIVVGLVICLIKLFNRQSSS